MSSGGLRVLLLGAANGEAERIRDIVTGLDPELECMQASNETELRAVLAVRSVDVVVCTLQGQPLQRARRWTTHSRGCSCSPTATKTSRRMPPAAARPYVCESRASKRSAARSRRYYAQHSPGPNSARCRPSCSTNTRCSNASRLVRRCLCS